jgi:patatin-like phospholipase/acyl hydrolase
MRGIYTAAFLDRLVTQFACIRGAESLDLGKGFDLITGTSTGAMVASALAVGRPMGDIVKLYRDHGRQIFPHRIKGTLSAVWRMFVGGSYVRRGDAVLRAALTDVLKGATMLDVFNKRGISLSIPTVAMSSHRAWVFKKTQASGVRDDHYPLVDVCGSPASTIPDASARPCKGLSTPEAAFRDCTIANRENLPDSMPWATPSIDGANYPPAISIAQAILP